MSATLALPGPAQLLALAHAALLDQIDRDDPAHALASLLAALGHATGRRLWLDASPCDAASHAADGTLSLPLQRLGAALGRLCVQPGADLPAPATAKALGAITGTLAALLLSSRSARQTGTMLDSGDSMGGGGGALIRAALRGAGTVVWEWHIPSDRLGDINEGLDQLGHLRQAGYSTQADWDALIHPDDRAANHAAYLRHAAGEADYYADVYRALGGDGGWRWVQERGRIVEWTADGAPLRMVGAQADITEHRRAEAAASEATERLSKIAVHVPGALYQFEIGADGSARSTRFPYISERCSTLFGLQPADLARDGMLLLKMIDPAHQAEVAASIEASRLSLQPWVQEFQLRRRDNTLRWIRGCATPQRMPGGQVLWHGYFEDLTEWQALARADHGQRVAEAANRAKNDFLSRMSHELRTPLNAVLGFAQLMGLDTTPPLSAEQQRRLALIRQSGEHLLAMIDDLLDLTSIEAGRLPLTPELVLLRPLADDALAMVQAAAQRQDLRLVCDGDAALQAWADRKRLRQVLINLLSNAIKYNRPGGSVRVHLRTQAGQVVLDVRDTGQGLSADECAQLFEPFNRLRQAHGPVEGSGIGLAVTHNLVRWMGGQIEVQSSPGQGSCFSVFLPAAAPPPVPPPAPPAVTPPTTAP